jgi:hypothetical protein
MNEPVLMLASVNNYFMNFICTALPEITWLLITKHIQEQYLPLSYQYGVKKGTVVKTVLYKALQNCCIIYMLSYLS